MNETLRVRRLRWWICLALAAVYLGFIAALTGLGLSYAPDDVQPVVLALAASGGGIIAGLGSWWLFLAWSHRLEIRGDAIVSSDAIAIRELLLRDVTRAVWTPYRGITGTVVLTTQFQQATIWFFRYGLDERNRLIQFLRRSLTEAQHEGWSVFCHNVALPLRKPDEPASAGKAIFSPRQCDRCALAVLGLALAHGLLSIRWFGNWIPFMRDVAAAAIVWVVVRKWIAGKTFRFARGPIAALITELIVSHLSFSIGGFGIIVLTLAFFDIPHMLSVGVTSLGILGATHFWQTWSYSRKQKARNAEEAEQSVREWDVLEAAAP